MFESLKRIAIQKLAAKMAGNALNSVATGEAAEEGAGAVMETIKNKLAGGNISQVTELFSGNNWESNEIFQTAKQNLTQVLESKGMSSAEAQAEAEATTPDLINGLKERFDSSEAADAEFDLQNISKWIPGNAGDLLNKAKNLLG